MKVLGRGQLILIQLKPLDVVARVVTVFVPPIDSDTVNNRKNKINTIDQFFNKIMQKLLVTYTS